MKVTTGKQLVNGIMLADAYIQNLPIEHLALTLTKSPKKVKDPESEESKNRMNAAVAKRDKRAQKRALGSRSNSEGGQ